MANGVHAGDTNALSQKASGSQSKIVMVNTYGFQPFNSEVLRVLADDGSPIAKDKLREYTFKRK